MAEADPVKSEFSVQSDEIPVEVLLGRRKLRPASVFELSFAPYDPESAHRSFVYHQPLTDSLCQMFLVQKKNDTVYQHINFASTRFNCSYGFGSDGEIKDMKTARREDGDYMPKDEIAMQLFTIIQLNCKEAAERLRKLSPIVCGITAKLEVIVDKFTSGNYGALLKPSLMLGKSKTRKFRMLHIYASVMYQIGLEFHSITCKIREVLNKSLIVDRVLVLPEIEELTKKCTFVPTKLLTRVEEFEQIIGTEKVVVDYVKGYGQINELLAWAREAFANISKGLKVDKEYRQEIEKLIDVIQQLDPDDAIKLDSVIASISCNAALLGNRRIYIPNVTMQCRCSILSSMAYVCHAADQLCTKAKGVPIMSFFIAHHTMRKLLAQIRVKRIKKQRIKTDKAKKKFKKLGAKLPAKHQALLRAEPELEKEEQAFEHAKLKFEFANAPKIPGPVGFGLEFRGEVVPVPSTLPPMRPRLSELHENKPSLRIHSEVSVFVSATNINSQPESGPETLPVPVPEEVQLQSDDGVPVPVTQLQPDAVMPVAELQPDVVMPVAELQPDAVPPVPEVQPETVVPVREVQPEPE